MMCRTLATEKVINLNSQLVLSTKTAVCNLASIALPRFVREKVCADDC